MFPEELERNDALGEAEKRFTFTCSNNVITMGININVLCFMLQCDTHVVTSLGG